MKMKQTKKIVLASGSPRRRELLSLMGLEYEVIKSEVEEQVTQSVPAMIVEELSGQKAMDVCSRVDPDTIVIGADTVVVMDGSIIGKPTGEEDAFRTLASLSGRVHEVYTGVTICVNGTAKTFHVCTKVFMDKLSKQEILDYIATGECYDKAGSYGIQGLGGRFVREIEGDYYNVVGLPVNRLYQELKMVM